MAELAGPDKEALDALFGRKTLADFRQAGPAGGESPEQMYLEYEQMRAFLSGVGAIISLLGSLPGRIFRRPHSRQEVIGPQDLLREPGSLGPSDLDRIEGENR